MLQRYRLLALDVDGTLLDSHHTLRDRVADAVSAATVGGLQVALATGKLLGSVRPLLERMNLSGSHIVLNGAAICESTTGFPLRFRPLEITDRTAIIQLVRALDPSVLISSFGLDAIYMDARHPRADIFAEYGEGPLVFVPDLLDPGLPDIAKVVLHGDAGQLEALRHLMVNQLPGTTKMTLTTADFLEFFDGQAGKGQALAALRSHLHIAKEAVIAIGDGDNDVSLFAESGLAIAMANGTEAARAAASRIAPTNDKDGVAIVLEELLAHDYLA